MIFLDTFDVTDGIIEGGLSESASLGGVVEDFVVEHREVKGKSESDGVSGAEFGIGDLRSLGVTLESTIGSFLVVISGGVLSDVSVVITLHLEEEDLSFSVLFRGKESIQG